MSVFRATKEGGGRKASEAASWERIEGTEREVPGEKDDVLLGPESGEITVTTAVKWRSLEVDAAYTGKFNQGSNLLGLGDVVGKTVKADGYVLNWKATATGFGSATNEIKFVGTSGTVEKIKIDITGNHNVAVIAFQSGTGKWEWTSNTVVSSAKWVELKLEKGELKTAGFNLGGLQVFSVSSSAEAVINCGTSEIEASKTGTSIVFGALATVTASEAIFVVSSGSGRFEGGGHSFGEVFFSKLTTLATGTITGSSTIKVINLGGGGGELKFTAGTTTSGVEGIINSAAAGKTFKVFSTVAGEKWKIKGVGGVIEVEGLLLKDSKAEGGTFEDVSGKDEGSSNEGWVFRGKRFNRTGSDKVELADTGEEEVRTGKADRTSADTVEPTDKGQEETHEATKNFTSSDVVELADKASAGINEVQLEWIKYAAGLPTIRPGMTYVGEGRIWWVEESIGTAFAWADIATGKEIHHKFATGGVMLDDSITEFEGHIYYAPSALGVFPPSKILRFPTSVGGRGELALDLTGIASGAMPLTTGGEYIYWLQPSTFFQQGAGLSREGGPGPTLEFGWANFHSPFTHWLIVNSGYVYTTQPGAEGFYWIARFETAEGPKFEQPTWVKIPKVTVGEVTVPLRPWGIAADGEHIWMIVSIGSGPGSFYIYRVKQDGTAGYGLVQIPGGTDEAGGLSMDSEYLYWVNRRGKKAPRTIARWPLRSLTEFMVIAEGEQSEESREKEEKEKEEHEKRIEGFEKHEEEEEKEKKEKEKTKGEEHEKEREEGEKEKEKEGTEKEEREEERKEEERKEEEKALEEEKKRVEEEREGEIGQGGEGEPGQLVPTEGVVRFGV